MSLGSASYFSDHRTALRLVSVRLTDTLDALGAAADEPLDDIPHLEVAADLRGRRVLAFVSENGAEGHHGQIAEAPERGDDVFRQPVGEVVAAALGAECFQRQDRNRGARRANWRRYGCRWLGWLRCQRRAHHPPRGAAGGDRDRHQRRDHHPETAATRWCCRPVRSEFRYCGDRLRSEAEGTHRPGDVLYPLLAEIIEGDRQFAANLVADGAGDAQPARLAQALQPRGNIDAVAENVAGLADDVADVDPDTASKPLVLRDALVSRRNSLLDRDGAGDSLDCAREFDENTVPGGLDDAAMVDRDRRVDQFAAMRP